MPHPNPFKPVPKDNGEYSPEDFRNEVGAAYLKKIDNNDLTPSGCIFCRCNTLSSDGHGYECGFGGKNIYDTNDGYRVFKIILTCTRYGDFDLGL